MQGAYSRLNWVILSRKMNESNEVTPMMRRFFSYQLLFIFLIWIMISAISYTSMLGPKLIRSLFTASAAEKVIVDRPFYQIEARFDPEKKEVTGHFLVRLSEKRTEPQTEAYFHLYPNIFRNWKYGEEGKPKKPGFIDIKNLKVDGRPVNGKMLGDTILRVPFHRPVPIGQTAQIEMDFRLKLPEGGTRLNAFNQTAFLAQWYPMLAVKDEEGWHIDPYTTTGDPFYTQMSDFEVTFHVPKGYRVISTGKDPENANGGTITIRQEQVRDFAAVITKDYQVVRKKAGQKNVHLWYLPGMEDVKDVLAEAAVSGLSFFSQRFGEYPYEEVDVVLGVTGYGIAGMEYPGLVTSIPKIPTDKGLKPAINVVVHELAHQWWYGVVGNDQVKEPWLDEGLTTFSEFLYMHEKMNEDDRSFLKRAAERTDEIHQSIGITSVESLYDYPDAVYGLMVYIRPAAMFYALIDEIGKEKVMEILRNYYHEYQFKTATTEDFLKIANRVAGKDLTPFFKKWLYFQSPSKGA